MHVHVRGNLVALWLACLAGPGSVAWADYVPVPIVEVGKPRLNDIAYSPDGGTLATLTGEWVELLDTDTFETVARFGQGGGRIEFSPDGSEIAVLRYHDSGSIYDVSTGTSKETLPATHRAYAFSPNWRRLAFSTDDIVHVWDRDTQAVTATLEGDPEPALLVVRSGSASTSTTRQRVNHLAFHPDGVRLLVASYRATVAAWDSFSGELIRHYSVGETWVQGMSIRPDGTDFAVYTERRQTLVWEFGGVKPRNLRGQRAVSHMSELQYDGSGAGLWSVGRGFLHQQNAEDGRMSVGWASGEETLDPPSTRSLSLDLSRGRAATRVGDRIGIWSVRTMRLERIVDHAWGAGSTSAGATYLPDRGAVVTFGRTMRRWELGAGDDFQTQEFPVDPYLLSVTKDGEVTATDVLGEVWVQRTSTGRRLATVAMPDGFAMAISATGNYVATQDYPGAAIWSAATGRKLISLPEKSINSLAFGFTPSERRLVIRTRAPGETLQVWDIATGELLMTVPGGGPFAATERGIIHVVWQSTGTAGAHFEVRRVGAARPMSVIEPLRNSFHGNIYNFVSIDPSGRYVTLVDDDPATGERTVRFFAADTGALLATRPESLRVQFTAGGDYLFAKGPNGGRALYRTEEFLNIPSHDVTPRNKALTAWGDVKRSQLLPNYPNPFNPETWIPFDLAAAGPVVVTVYDAAGSVVRRLDLGDVTAGTHRTRERAAYWNGRDDRGESVASGVYTYRVEGPGLSDSGRMLLIK